MGQFPQDFIVRGEAMWCKCCDVAVSWKEKVTATNHLASKGHIANKKRAFEKVMTLGASAKIEPQAQQENTQPAKKTKVTDIKEVFSVKGAQNKITDDFVAL